MKLIKISLLFVTLFTIFNMDADSQSIKNYETSWKRVDEFMKKNLPKSALAEVKKIYQNAKKDAAAGSPQGAQLIKSLVYITGLQAETREDNEVFSISEIEKEITAHAGKETVSAILNSLLAEMYWNYYQQNRWDLYNRSETSDFKKDDISTWSTDDFHKKIGELYLASLKNEKLLQQTSLQAYEAIIIKGNVRHLRPTLFDLLAQRALVYFKNDERDISKPAYAFEIDQASAFDPAADFISHKFPTKDSMSLQQKALVIYQRLIAFHLNDKKPDALIDADLARIEFVWENSTHPQKDEFYFNAINHVARQYEDLPAGAQAWYLLAAFYNRQASEYKPFGDTTHRYARVKAKDISEKILKQKDSSEGKINSQNLLNEINRQSLQFSLEKVNIPGQPFRALVEYKNFTRLFLRLVKPTEGLKNLLESREDDKFWESVTTAAALRDWQQNLPATNDYQQHSVEIKIDALPAGEYLLIASTENNFKSKKSLLGARLFYVSNISFVNNEEDYFVLNRDNGQPLPGAAVQVWEAKYDYSQSKYIREKTKQYKTDANGFFKKEKKLNSATKRYENSTYQFDITYKSERLFMDDMIHDYYYYRDNMSEGPKTTNSVFLFADRSLYRPAQTVFFKGIVLGRITAEKKAWANGQYSTTVYLRDANYQDIDSIKVTTNEYGSFAGKFQLPQGGLNGAFGIYTKKDDGNVSFHVEEYKRPRFYVEYEPLKGTYKVNDTIQITGMAKAYAGNNIDGAQVKYRVVRQPRFLYPWLFWRGWFPPTAPMEIAHGEAITDRDGKFVVSFSAIPDPKLDKKLEPVFDYTVYADVTDINGETRSGEQRVSVGYKALLLKTNIPATLAADSLKSLSIRTENMNGEFEPAVVTVTITKLKNEQRLIRDRYWERPDQFVMNKEEYIRNFPQDEFDNETDPKTWQKAEKVFDRKDSARANSEWPVINGKFVPGFYVVEISTGDKNGEEVKDVKYVELYDEKNKRLDLPQYLWAVAADAIEPGEKAEVKLGSSADNLFVVQQIDKSSELGVRSSEPVETQSRYSFIKLNNEKQSFEFTAAEEDRGGYGVSWLFVKHNRVYQYNQTIMVPWTNKDLSIEYATYRDKTLPGSEEKWKLKITGYKNEELAAEMLASMYDASLDQFYPHQWHKPGIWPTYYNRSSWDGKQNFVKLDLTIKDLPYPDSKTLNKVYDELTLNIFQADHLFNKRLAGRMAGLEVMEMKAANPAPTMAQAADSAVSFNIDADGVANEKQVEEEVAKSSSEVQIRKNFNETAFFFPDLKTDSTGAIEFSFTIPEALTQWKFQALAHTKTGALGYSSKEIITQKQLMVQPNPPRFLREGDKMELSTKIVNLTDKELTGTAELQLVDASTNQPVDGWFNNMIPNQYFTVAAGQSEAVKFPIAVPFQFNKALVWRIIAKAGDHSDGEENAMPVLTNRMLVTETMPLPMNSPGTKTFNFDKLLKSGNSETLQHHSLTVEYTSNPAWYAVQALPYLMEYPYDCSEQTWNRYYANTLASFIVRSSPRIRQVFEKWKSYDTAALLSNLQKNEELKAVLLEETPWVLQAKSEAEQKQNIALLFDMVRMSNELNSSYEKLKQMQSSNGGFVWFKGGPDDRYITQYIVTGIGHLKKLKAFDDIQRSKLNEILATAITYLDKKLKTDYDDLIKSKTDLEKYTPSHTAVQFLYMRSFFPEYPIANASKKAYDYFRGQAQRTWTKQNKYIQGMLVLALGRTGDTKTPAAILASLKETAITHEELGMYWKDARRGWFWHEAPIERQSLLIEAFQEIGKDNKTVDLLRTWLLKNKQTNRWESTKATAEACYALLLQGTDWMQAEPTVQIKLGNTTISSTDVKQEAGTGYFKQTIDGKNVKADMGNIAVAVEPVSSNKSTSSWGSVYWQYFEDLDKITVAATPLKLEKKLFVENNSDRGPVLTPVNDGDFLKVGDKIKVRIVLRVDREMEYVHMKDMRASALEPVNVLSGYKWQEGLGYYESTKDASTNFFFSRLPKGTYVFEYPLFITHAGNFSNGITSIQCMYAPEFSSHSEGVRINVE